MEARVPARAAVAAAVGVLVLLPLLAAAASANDAAGDSQCADQTARNVLSTLGGRSRLVTVLMNYVKCLQHASGDLYKLVTDILIEVESCAAKSDLVETIRCALSDAGLKKMNSLVLRLMEVTKCALE